MLYQSFCTERVVVPLVSVLRTGGVVPGKTIGQLIRNQNGMKQGNVPKKAVVIKPPGVQLCNRLRNLMAGVILAMLTGTAPATSTTLLYRVPDWWYCLLCSLVLVVHPLQPECPMSSTKLHICYTMSGFDPGHVGSDRAVQYSFKRGYYAESFSRVGCWAVTDFEALFDSPLDLNPFPPEGGGKVVSGAGGYQASLCDDLAAGSDAASPILNIEHHTWYPICLCNSYAMSGTDQVYGARTCWYELPYGAICLRNLYVDCTPLVPEPAPRAGKLHYRPTRVQCVYPLYGTTSVYEGLRVRYAYVQWLVLNQRAGVPYGQSYYEQAYGGVMEAKTGGLSGIYKARTTLRYPAIPRAVAPYFTLLHHVS
eukprot:1100595-Rhodomonas_salina.2